MMIMNETCITMLSASTDSNLKRTSTTNIETKNFTEKYLRKTKSYEIIIIVERSLSCVGMHG